jgi:undecaprenyl-diphosphatase
MSEERHMREPDRKRELEEALEQIRSPEDAERVVEHAHHEITSTQAERIETPSQKRAAEAIENTAREAATLDDGETELDETILETTSPQADRDTPEYRAARSLLRAAVIRRLKPLQALDALAFIRINQLPHPWLADRFFAGLSRVMTRGDGWLIFVLARLASGRRRAVPLLADVVLPLWLATATVEFPIKRFFRRHRPFISIVDAVIVGRKPGSYSFPSGHSASAFAGAFLLRPFFPKLRPLILAIAGLTCFSRVYLGAHYPGDVVTGAASGSVLASFFRGIVRRMFRR